MISLHYTNVSVPVHPDEHGFKSDEYFNIGISIGFGYLWLVNRLSLGESHSPPIPSPKAAFLFICHDSKMIP